MSRNWVEVYIRTTQLYSITFLLISNTVILYSLKESVAFHFLDMKQHL